MVTVPPIRPIDPDWLRRAERRLDRLTKPAGSLGRLEWIAARLCAIQETLAPETEPRRIVVFAADHGVAAEGVSAFPQAVTAQMLANFSRGGAAINALARVAGAELVVVDVGVAEPTRNFLHGPAMTHAELDAAFQAGVDAADAAAAAGVRLLGCGDMGIGNTTSASAITAAITGAPVERVTGRGTGVDADRLAHKTAVVARALDVNPARHDPLEVLRCLGGFEIAALAGAYLRAAQHRLTIVGDGFVATAAALVAAEVRPAFLDYWFAGHRSPEPGHTVQLEHLRQPPLLDLGLRLGEATGAALAMPVIGAAAAMIGRMATFDEAGVALRT